MSDTIPAEKPVNDGGNAPQPEPESDASNALLDAEALEAEKPANQGGGGSD